MKTRRGKDTPLEVLLVEDSPGNVRLTREAFRDAEMAINLHVASDGVAAIEFLKHEGDHAAALRPDFILLDLNLPRMDGREVRSDQGRSDAEDNPYRHLDVIRGGSGYRQKLSTAGELLSQQAGAVG